MKIKTPTIIHIENISNKIVNYEPKGQNFIISIKPNHSYEFKLNRSEDVLYYLKQSSKDLLSVEQIKEFSKKRYYYSYWFTCNYYYKKYIK